MSTSDPLTWPTRAGTSGFEYKFGGVDFNTNQTDRWLIKIVSWDVMLVGRIYGFRSYFNDAATIIFGTRNVHTLH